MHSAVVRADDLKYSDEGVRDVLKGILIPLWNSYSFYVTYANIDGVTPPTAESLPSCDNPLTSGSCPSPKKWCSMWAARSIAMIFQSDRPIVDFVDR